MQYEFSLTITGVESDDKPSGSFSRSERWRTRLMFWLLRMDMELDDMEWVDETTLRSDGWFDPGIVGAFVATVPITEIEDVWVGVWADKLDEEEYPYDDLTVEVVEAPSKN